MSCREPLSEAPDSWVKDVYKSLESFKIASHRVRAFRRADPASIDLDVSYQLRVGTAVCHTVLDGGVSKRIIVGNPVPSLGFEHLELALPDCWRGGDQLAQKINVN